MRGGAVTTCRFIPNLMRFGARLRDRYGRLSGSRSKQKASHLGESRCQGPGGSLDLDAVTGADVRVVVPDRLMLGAAVVPERDRVLPPMKTDLEIRLGHVLVEELQNRRAL